MGTAERREREKTKRRMDILKTALAMFFENGYESASMDMIADRLELSKGTLYRYFKSKDDLLISLGHDALQLMYKNFKAVRDSEDSPLDKIRRIGLAYFQFHKDNPAYVYILHKTENVDPNASLPESLSDFIGISNACHQIVADVLREGVEKKYFNEDINIYETAFMLWATTSGIILMGQKLDLICVPEFSFTLDEILEKYWKMMINTFLVKKIGE